MQDWWSELRADGARSGQSDPLLFAADSINSAVDVFDLALPGNPTIYTISYGMSTPIGIALDKHGTLYVANRENAGSGSVTVYVDGIPQPSRTITGLTSIFGIAVAPDGAVYVGQQTNPASIAEIDRGQTTPTRLFTGREIRNPWRLAFDSAGTLYLADVTGGVSIKGRHARRFKSLHLNGIASPNAIAIDPVNGNLFVSNFNGNAPYIDVYAPGSQQPAYTLQSSGIGTHLMTVGVVGSHEYLFAPGYGTYVPIYVFDAASMSGPFEYIPDSMRGINGVAFLPAGRP